MGICRTRKRNLIDGFRVTLELSKILTRHRWIEFHCVRWQWHRHCTPIFPFNSQKQFEPKSHLGTKKMELYFSHSSLSINSQLNRGIKRTCVLWDDLENIVITEIGLDRVFKAEAFNVVGVGWRLVLDIHGRTGFHMNRSWVSVG